MPKLSLLYLILAVVIIACGQIGMKYVAINFTFDAHSPLRKNVIDNAQYIGILAIVILSYAVSTILWILALRDTPLSLAYLFNAFAFIFVPALAVIIFQERVNYFYVIGVLLIAAGVIFSIKGSNV